MRMQLLAVLLLACAGCAQPVSRPPTSGSGEQQGTRATPQRTLVVAVRVEPATLVARDLQEASGVGLYLTRRMFNADLALLDGGGAMHPYLTEALPQLNTDTSKVFPNGRMETTYRLKPSLAWHDGTPLAADDFAFAWRLYANPALGMARRLPMCSMEDVIAVDSQTFVVHWNTLYPDAAGMTDRHGDLPALPRHILARQYDEDPQSVLNHPYWTREFVGLGPYRVERWEPGAFIEANAFAGHALGKPRIDRIKMLFMSDSNAVLAAMRAGDVHLSADSSLRAEHAILLKRDWAERQGGDVLFHPNQWRAVHVQHRAEIVNPRALLDVRVRKALAYTIDRTAINEAVYGGTLGYADSVISPRSEWGQAADRAAVKYPLDLRRAEQLLGEAGFAKAPDGIYSSASAGRLSVELKTNAASDNEAEMSIMAAGWRQVGMDVQEAVLPAAQAQDNEVRSTFRGLYSNNTPPGEAGIVNHTSSRIPRPETRWNGSNRGGWSDAEYDRLADAFGMTLDRAERNRQVAEMVRIFTDDVAAISLFFRVQPWVYISAIKGLDREVAPEAMAAWNIHQWTFE
jgi:peptide/nickel transport system substrate-binding protein